MTATSSSAGNFYRHSGKTPLLGLILLGAAGLVAIPILGLIYGYLIFYIPLLYLSILLVFGYALVVSFVIYRAAIWGKIRNTLMVGLTAFGFGLLAEYTGWVAWIAAIAKDPSYLLEFFFPLDVISLIVEIGKQGAWSFNNITPSGAILYFIWLMEAVIVIGGVTYSTLKQYSRVPFCEDSDAWAGKKSSVAAFAPLPNADQFKASVSQGNYSIFQELKPVQSGNAFTLFEAYACDICKNFFVLNVSDVKVSVDYKGRSTRREKPIVSNLIVTPTTLSTLKRLMQEQQAVSAPSPTG